MIYIQNTLWIYHTFQIFQACDQIVTHAKYIEK